MKCQPCDDCIKSLTNFTAEINTTLISTEEMLILINLLQSADTFDLDSISMIVEEFYNLSNDTQLSLTEASNKLGELDVTKIVLITEFNSLKEQVNYMHRSR